VRAGGGFSGQEPELVNARAGNFSGFFRIFIEQDF
jgi:hypothetical protein